jgi:hypothetical protein
MPYNEPFLYTQTTASNLWMINHNLGVYPIVDVIVNDTTGLVKIIPMNIYVIDLNNVSIEFSIPRTGQARLV